MLSLHANQLSVLASSSGVSWRSISGRFVGTRWVPLDLHNHKNFRFIQTESYRKQLSFFLNGKKTVVDGSRFDPETTLIHYLRVGEGLTGTKLTCGEGGCGACTVTLSFYDRQQKKVLNRSVNACLVPLYYVDGMEVTTVEGIGSVRNALHPVQERLSLFGGSQCGFCTPGFIMSMYTTLRNNPSPSIEEFQKNLDGNLCRCTGYRAIIDAAKSFCVDTKDSVILPGHRQFASFNPSKDSELPLESPTPKAMHIKGSRSEWYSPTTLQDLLELKSSFPDAKLICGSTELGIDLRFKYAKLPVMISPTHVPEMSELVVSESGLSIGAAVTLSHLMEKLHDLESKLSSSERHRLRLINAILDQLKWFAGTQIRNVATLGGNIVNASPISDLNPVWLSIGALFKVGRVGVAEKTIPAHDFFIGYKKVNLAREEVLVSIFVPWNKPNEYIESYKQSRRREDDIAIVTTSMLVALDGSKKVLKAKLAFGGMAPCSMLALKTERFLIGKDWSQEIFDRACEVLISELGLSGDPPGGMAEYRNTLMLSFFYKFFLAVTTIVNEKEISSKMRSATMKLYSPRIPIGKQIYDVPRRGTSVGDSEPHLSSKKQVTGEALYTDDFPRLPKELYAALVTSTKANAKLIKVDASSALKIPGVIAYLGHKDIPGKNIWGDIVADEELLASERVYHYGQPIGVIVADSEYIAKQATKLVIVEYEEDSPASLYSSLNKEEEEEEKKISPLPSSSSSFSIDDAIRENSFFDTVHGIRSGDIDKGFQNAEQIIEGHQYIGGQEQFYFEPMIAIAVPEENDMILYTSTQNANKTQKIVAAALGLPIHRVVCRVPRIGGGFGGKETRNINFGAIAAVAARNLNRPVRLLLERDLDMTITGGRHPFKCIYKVGLSKEGIITAADLQLYLNCGFSHDLSVPVLDRALLFCDSCYRIPNFRNVGKMCKTNMPSNTAFRGFGGPQGHLFTESWIEHAAQVLKIPSEELRERNLYNEGDFTYYGFPVPRSVRRSWEICKQSSDFLKRKAEVENYNKEHRWRKRGLSIIPSKYGIAFTANFLNQGTALVHVYTDGSVAVTHGGVEMGQGLNTKVAQVVATELGISVDKIHIREMATDKIPNASATAASMGSDIYGMAAWKACQELNERLKPYRKSMPNASFAEIAQKAYLDRVNLSSQGFFKSEHEGYNIETGKGKPWRYFTVGAGCTEVEIDCLTGDHKILRTDLVVDIGTPINPSIDIGQIEGAFMQGAGWVTIEELVWGDDQHSWVKPKGRLATNGPGSYKLPSADDIPLDWRITLLKDPPDPKLEILPVQSAKAVGEPPLLLGISVFTAIREAIRSARKEEGLHDFYPLDSPLTSERIRMACVDQFSRLAIGDRQKAESFRAKGSF